MLIGLIERAGTGVPKIYRGWASGHWQPPIIQEFQNPERTLVTLPMIELLSLRSGGLSPKSCGLSPKSGDLNPKSGDLNPRSGDLRVIQELNELSKAEQERLLKISDQAKKRRKIKPEEVQSYIQDLCANAFLSLTLISSLLGKTEDYTRKAIVTPMFDSGILQRAHTQPNHPQQGYKSFQSRA